MSYILDNLRFVLLHTSHSGNIGSAARAMKTMGFKRLYLVAPKDFPSGKAKALASSAADLLDEAVVCDSLEEAVADCHVVYGSGSELRTLEKPVLMPREMAREVVEFSPEREIAVVFGRESYGMLNEELALCQKHIQIPGNPEYSSLNLAAAVQVMAYELRTAWLSYTYQPAVEKVSLATAKEMEGFYEHLKSTMLMTGFYDPVKPKLMSRLRRIFNEAKLRKKEIDLLRGFLRSVNKLTDSGG